MASSLFCGSSVLNHGSNSERGDREQRRLWGAHLPDFTGLESPRNYILVATVDIFHPRASVCAVTSWAHVLPRDP